MCNILKLISKTVLGRISLDNQKMVILALGVSIVLIIQYFLVSNLVDQKESESLEMFQKGYDIGIESTIKSLFVKTDNCQPTEIFMNETKRVLFDFNCLETNP